MDEVLAVGDLAFQKKCLEKMRQAANEEGRTVLYVSHNMNTIRTLCNRCVVLDHGKIIFEGDVEKAIEIYANVMAVSDQTVSLAELPRNPHETTGEIHMEQVKVLNAQTWRVDVGSELRFSVTASCLKPVKDLGFRSRLSAGDDTVISVYLAPDITDCKAGERLEFQFAVDTTMLIPGTYKLNLAFYGMNEYGGEQFYDRLENAVSFEVQTVRGFNHNKQWDRFSWGIVKLPEMTVLGINRQ